MSAENAVGGPDVSGGGREADALGRGSSLKRENDPRSRKAPEGVRLIPIGKDEGDSRFFIRVDDRHAGGITVHSVRGESFSYGIAVAKEMRGKGAASAALGLLFERMKAQGFARAVVRIEERNEASLALHRKLGFAVTGVQDGIVFLQREL